MGSGGLTTGGAGTPVVGSESGGFSTGGGREARMSRKALLRDPAPALVAPTDLFLPFMDAVTAPLAFPLVNTPPWEPLTLETDMFATAKLPPFWAAATDAVASSSSVGRLAVSPRR